MAISISNQVWFSWEREEEYRQLARTYEAESMSRFSDMMGMLWEAFDTEINDYLGQIYMEGNMGNKSTGQFFTPFHLAELVAMMQPNDPEQKVIVNEPACGGGGMVLAKAKAIQAAGGNYQDTLKVIAQDLDWTGVYMTYTQLSMAGINAVVIQGDTLTGEKAGALQKFYTPLYVLKCI
jgi:type I restriction-modification system DNA methylase subunit